MPLKPLMDGATLMPTKSFAAILSLSSAIRDFDSSIVSTHSGEPALRMSKQDIMQLAQPFHNVLIGRFSFSRPSMDVIRKFFLSLGHKGWCKVGLLDANHVLICPSAEEDSTRLFVRRTWYIQSSPMLISKWSLDFQASKKVLIALVWVSSPELLVPFFWEEATYQIGFNAGEAVEK